MNCEDYNTARMACQSAGPQRLTAGNPTKNRVYFLGVAVLYRRIGLKGAEYKKAER